LFLKNSGSISKSLIEAVEREFPWTRVEQGGAVDTACAAFTHPVGLILVDVTSMKKAEAAAAGHLHVIPLH
jgi:hypothetical protein